MIFEFDKSTWHFLCLFSNETLAC